MEINHLKEEDNMHIAISKGPETGSVEINPNKNPEPDENREITGTKYRKQANSYGTPSSNPHRQD